MITLMTPKTPDNEFEESISEFYKKLLAKQEPLGVEFETVLNDNFWDLLVTDEKRKIKP